MTTIDVENAKQIRQPMQVEISVTLSDTGSPLTYSGYAATAKVADGVLGQQTWPMRQLADLQGDGFPLDGSRELYETKTASQANGKLGVRGHVGQNVEVTVSRGTTIPAVTVYAQGADYVDYGGTAYSLTDGTASILIGATSASFTFTPTSNETRVEVSLIISTIDFVIRSDTLIRAVVSLRSDLSIVSPTLPESELNVEAYVSTDVSEYVAGIEEDTPITYSAGYVGDMSEIRKFYVSGRITWANNVLTINAVDAVHFLEVGIPALQFRRSPGLRPDGIGEFLKSAIGNIVGETYASTRYFYSVNETKLKERPVILDGLTLRETVAFANNVFRFRNVQNSYCENSSGAYIFDFVDAGIPKVHTFGSEKTPSWVVREEDCDDVKKEVERKVGKILLHGTDTKDQSNFVNPYYNKVSAGSVKWTKNVGADVSLDEYVYAACICIEGDQVGESTLSEPVIPMNGYGSDYTINAIFPVDSEWYWNGIFGAVPLLSGARPNGELTLQSYQDYAPIYTQFVDWNCNYNGAIFNWNSQADAWAEFVRLGVIDQNTTDYDLNLTGAKLSADIYNASYTNGPGVVCEIEPPIKGKVFFSKADNNKYEEAYPKAALQTLFKRSNITGSFVWKGDPRMQPRDVVTFHRLDGTDEVITLENITITHEGGGTSAEITYRKGIV